MHLFPTTADYHSMNQLQLHCPMKRCLKASTHCIGWPHPHSTTGRSHPMLHRKAFAYANQQSEWIAHRMLISIGTYWAIYDWLAQLGHTLPHPILANWLILSASCRCSSISGTCAHWVGQEKSELDIKNIFRPISGHSTTSHSQHWMDPLLNVWITFFFLGSVCCKNCTLTENWTHVKDSIVLQTPPLTNAPNCHIYCSNWVAYIESGTQYFRNKKNSCPYTGHGGYGHQWQALRMSATAA